MKKNILITGSVITLLMLNFTGCAVKGDLFTKEIDRSGIDLIVMEEGSKVTYLKDPNTLERFCASREIDTTKTFNEGLGLGLSAGGTQEQISGGEGTGAIALGGRSPAVLITREMMFRACELALNLNLDSEKTIEIYKMFLEYTNKLIKNEHDKGSQTAVSQAMNINTTQNSENSTVQNDDEESDGNNKDEGGDDEEDD
ncbi:MAG: hypothetical protein AB7D38_03550 [Sulfurimonas sp.]|uniref:hypothetical protein n=1 Tax=Sulfurimonas sp. TaxID=2022749 RepID=UPI000CCF33C5|nr:MAG: hypothetical protein C0627_05730 [Sulfurimonas sp.]